MPKVTFAIAVLGLVAGLSAQAVHPSHNISNGQIQAMIYLPDAEKGFYRTTRFDWSGVIGSLRFKGHEFYDPWYQRVADVDDLAYEGKDIVSAPFTAMTGPGEEYNSTGGPLGYSEAPVGGTFIKIGVGVLRKPATPQYNHSRPYEIVDSGKWTVKTAPASVEFTQELKDPATGYAYLYNKVVRLTPGKAEMVIAHRLRNTGTKVIQTTVYNHNFLVLDNQPPGPDFVVKFPYAVTPAPGRAQGPAPAAGQAPRDPAVLIDRLTQVPLGEVRGNEIRYTKVLQGEERMTTSVTGFSNQAKDYDIRVENSKLGVGFRVTADTPLSRVAYWSIRTVMAVEPYNEMTIKPGDEHMWTLTYTYYQLPASR